ncbi:MAG: sugar transferase [Porphyrobacter sp.]|nr:sugar transferase [Porphyrobacter sp.]
MIADCAGLYGCFWLCALAYLGRPPVPQEMLSGQLLLPIFLTIAMHNRTYSLKSLTDWRIATSRMLAALLVSALMLTFLAYGMNVSAVFSRVIFVSGIATAAMVMAATRWLITERAHRLWGPSALNVLLIDAGGPPLVIPNTYRIAAREHGLEPTLEDPHLLDRLAGYLRNMDQVIVSCPQEERAAWAMVLKGSGVHGEIATPLVREIGALGVVHREEAGISSLLVSVGALGLRARLTKRAFDIAVSVLALIVVAPVLAGAAVLIRLEDGGPVLFRQRRLGRGNRFFNIYKLRTMRVEQADADGHRSAARDDDRITRIGRFLRKSSIDELPQLFNVLKGEMSIVGPRPHALGSQAGSKLFWQVDSRYWQRHSLRPGITGLAQVRGLRGATETESDLSSRLLADLEYASDWTIWRDLQILLATASVVIHDRAY